MEGEPTSTDDNNAPSRYNCNYANMKRVFIRKLYFANAELMKIEPEYSVTKRKLSCAPSETGPYVRRATIQYTALRQTGVGSHTGLTSHTSAGKLGKSHALIKRFPCLVYSYLCSSNYSKFFCGEGPRSRRYGRTAALRLLVQPCDEDD
jgi:hypothetical protein